MCNSKHENVEAEFSFPPNTALYIFFCNLLAHKNHTHSPSKPTLTKTAVREEKTMRCIVEEQSVKSPPALPTQSQHMLGVNQLFEEHRENIHPQKLLTWSHSLKSYRTLSVRLPFRWLLHSKTVFQAWSFKGKSTLFLFFRYFFIFIVFSQGEKWCFYMERVRLNLRLSEVEPKEKIICSPLPVCSAEALLCPAPKWEKEGF